MFSQRKKIMRSLYKKALSIILSLCLVTMVFPITLAADAAVVNDTDNPAFSVTSYDTSARITIPFINDASGYKVYLSQAAYQDISSLTSDPGMRCVLSSDTYKSYVYACNGDADAVNTSNTVSINPGTTYYFYLVTGDGSTETLQSAFKTSTKSADDCYWTGTGHYDTGWYTPDAAEYKISTESQLAGLAVLNNGLNGVTAVNFSGKTIKLSSSLNMSAWLWTPIGTPDLPFEGTLFDGGVYDGGILVNTNVIVGLHTNTNNKYRGLFGYSKSNIQNLGVVDSCITGNSCVGSISGVCRGVVSNCYSTGTVSGSMYVGGIAGFSETISNCYNMGRVYGSDSYIGGISGRSGTISNSYNSGIVSGGLIVGGICGKGSLSGCSNTGAVTGNSKVGGLSGYVYSDEIENCFNTGSVSGTEDIGGIGGYSDIGSVVTNTYNTGTVSGNIDVGGISGYFNGNLMENCYSSGTVKASSDQAGGVVARKEGGTISDCYYNKEAVTADNGIGVGKTGGELKNLAETLGSAYVPAPTQYVNGGVFSTENPVNGGYPVLKAFGYTGGTNLDSQFENEPMDSYGFIVHYVKNVYQLDLVRNYQSYSGDYFKLTNNIDLSPVQYSTVNAGWKSIGGKFSYISGTFDGCGFSISGLTGSSLFGYNWTTIKNLSVTDVNIQCSDTAGSILSVNYGTVSDCGGTGVVVGLNQKGGIVGIGLDEKASIIGCRNACTTGGTVYIGGIAGYDGWGNITDCTNVGTVYQINKPELGSDYSAGGIAGASNNLISCKNLGTVTGYTRTGGIVGYSMGTVIHCENSGTVNGDDSAGGIAGLSYSISSCKNTGNVFAIASGSHFIGGIVGFAQGGQISNCQNKGMINKDGNINNKGGYIGGIAGFTWAKIEKCCNEGPVSGRGTIAGIAAGCNNAAISACYNTGAITGNISVSGILQESINSYFIYDCYNTGTISGLYASAISGSTNGSVSNCYYCGADQGIGGNASQTGTAAFASLVEKTIKPEESTVITEQTGMNDASLWNGVLGADFMVTYGGFQSSNEDIADVSGLTVTGGKAGTANISCTMEITQNELDLAEGTGFTGAVKAISVPITLPLTVTKATPSIAADSGTATVGEDVTLSAAITNGYHPAGTVTFKNNGTIIGSTTAITDGSVKISYMPVSINDLSITAEYSGDENNEGALSTPITVTVNKKSPVLSKVEAAPASPQPYPVSVTLSSTLSNYFGTLSGVPVSFYNGDMLLGSGTTDEHGAASYTLKNPGTATYQFIAKFEGNTNNNPAVVSGSTSYTVNKGTQAALTIGGIPNLLTYGDAPFILLPSGGSGTGNTYTYESGSPDVLSVDNSGTVTVNKAGEAAITATKAGDTNYNPISKTIMITVAKKTLDAVITPSDKQYDTTPSATVKKIAYSGVVGSDDIYITGGNITFTDKTASTEKTAIASGYGLGGAKAANYTLGTIAVSKAAIQPVNLIVQNTAVRDKIYDGTTFTQFSGTPTLGGVLSGDKVTLSNEEPAFENKNYSSNAISVNVSVFSISGSDAKNYTLIQPEDVYAHISKKTLMADVAPVTINCGQSIHSLSVEVSGFVSGESENNVAGFSKPAASPIYSSPTTSAVADVPLNVVYSDGNATNNYEFSYSYTTSLTIRTVAVNDGDYQVFGKYALSENPADWNTGNFTITPSNGYDLISTDGTTWMSKLTVSTEGQNRSVTFKLKKRTDGMQTESKTICYNLDKTMPTIRVTENPVDLVKKVRLTILATADGSGIKSIMVNGKNITDTYKNGYTITKNGEYKFMVTNGAGVTAEQVIKVSEIVPTVITDAKTGLAFNLSNANLPSGVTSVSVSSTILPESGAGSGVYAIVKGLIGSSNLGSLSSLAVYDLKLLDQNGKPIRNFTGKIKVMLPIPAGMSGVPRIFWYDTVKGTLTDMNAVQQNGCMVFETTHFSYYAMAVLKSVSTSAPNPPTGRGNTLIFLLTLLVVGTAVLVVVRKPRKYRVKK